MWTSLLQMERKLMEGFKEYNYSEDDQAYVTDWSLSFYF